MYIRVRVVEGTVKSVIKNEATGQVLGVQYVRRGLDYREYVLPLPKLVADCM
jgi:hypothetical protein